MANILPITTSLTLSQLNGAKASEKKRTNRVQRDIVTKSDPGTTSEQQKTAVTHSAPVLESPVREPGEQEIIAKNLAKLMQQMEISAQKSGEGLSTMQQINRELANDVVKAAHEEGEAQLAAISDKIKINQANMDTEAALSGLRKSATILFAIGTVLSFVPLVAPLGFMAMEYAGVGLAAAETTAEVVEGAELGVAEAGAEIEMSELGANAVVDGVEGMSAGAELEAEAGSSAVVTAENEVVQAPVNWMMRGAKWLKLALILTAAPTFGGIAAADACSKDQQWKAARRVEATLQAIGNYVANYQSTTTISQAMQKYTQPYLEILQGLAGGAGELIRASGQMNDTMQEIAANLARAV